MRAVVFADDGQSRRTNEETGELQPDTVAVDIEFERVRVQGGRALTVGVLLKYRVVDIYHRLKQAGVVPLDDAHRVSA